MRIEDLENLKNNWDSEIEPPNETAMNNLKLYLGYVNDITQLKGWDIVPSVEGGCGIFWTKEYKYADIEFYNDGSIAAITTDRVEPGKAWEVENMFETLVQIRDFLND